jgi:RHS repeat-associated protein
MERQWYHTDTLGSVLARTDVDGNVVAQFDYEPWGERWHAAGLAVGVDGDRQYNGRVYDQGTGFHDYGARLYWPEIGRFISADSYLGDPANPASLNRYSYVHNNPYKYTDPTGHFAFALPALYAAGAWCAMGGCQRLVGLLAAAVELAPGIESALEQAQAAQQAQASKGGKAAETPAQAEPATEGARPESLTPAGAGRAGALNEAKRRNDVPTSQQPEEQGPNRDRKGNVQPGRQYKYKDSNGKEVIIRDDAKGHDYGPGNPQNRGPHLNDQNGGHYDYPAR